MEPTKVKIQQPEMRVLPYNTEAEQSLLGALLVENSLFENVSEFLLPVHFYRPVNAKIYEVIKKLITAGEVADPITLGAYFERNGEFESIGGSSYFVQLANSIVSLTDIEDYANLIYELYLRRQLILLGESIAKDAAVTNLEKRAVDQIEAAESKLYELSVISDKQGGFLTFDNASLKTLGGIEQVYRSKRSIIGITTGLVDVDNYLGGLGRSDLVILAGRPSMGKTALATNMAFNAALAAITEKEGGGKVAFFSLEMSAEQLVTRILAQECEIIVGDIRRGTIKDEDYMKLAQKTKQLASLPLYIDDTPALTVSAIRTRARKLKRQHGLDLIVIDYLQLIQGSAEKRNENRVQEVSEITRSLKALAKELNVPVIALSQLSRSVEARDDKHPQLADLRESGSIEQDADVVMFVYREEYYMSRNIPEEGSEQEMKWLEKYRKIQCLAELIVAKQRQGQIGTVKLYFDGRFTKFGNLARNEGSMQ